MAIVNVVQVRKEFAERVLFSDISFEIGPRDHIGLIGVNGCGKSTLIQMIEGRLRPDGGFIAMSPQCTVACVEQLPKLSEDVKLYDFVLQARRCSSARGSSMRSSPASRPPERRSVVGLSTGSSVSWSGSSKRAD